MHRRWRSQLVYPGRTYRTNLGRIVIGTVDQLDADAISDADALAAAKLTADEVRAQLRGQPDWPVFRIGFRLADDLDPRDDLARGAVAAHLGRETAPFKLDVRKLKNLGVTFSLEVGYRLAPRGETFLRWLS